MEDIFDYNIIDPKNKKRLTKDLENLPSKELIKMINVLIKSQNTSFKLLDNFENLIEHLKEKVRLLEDINSKYKNFFNKLN
ncbi:hypothetical protein PJV94_07025 [Aliarcobacter butzleri]|uniref:hypothetical protein n=1 Tax=Aliarcobacter butzleri TaxID=28197 RepID=UPI00263C37C4|nr:hypothetical protein [Aliarcobacter butzleri]MDN5073374.1 hypothetical protein [Aliarcobacter butzleri]MDN5121428.1 hypothetical protein [Aliarcobacter butzleri]MDN5130837.1 hypothetical protein [Aliarcobacter butzleri]